MNGIPIKKTISEFLNLIYPNTCIACHKTLVQGEQHLCFQCLSELAFTSFHLQPDNPIEQRFWGKIPVCRATALFIFQKETHSQLILHHLKYKGNKDLGAVMGRMLGEKINGIPGFDVDLIIPVPLHPKKLAKRGYNQSEWIAKGISEKLNVPVDTHHLIRVIENPTQTKKGVYERWENTSGIFDVQDVAALKEKHILLVDDVITTGSTMEACVKALQKVDKLNVSMAFLAAVIY
ncbi:MAG: ComF family protein [Microbacter sp.]